MKSLVHGPSSMNLDLDHQHKELRKEISVIQNSIFPMRVIRDMQLIGKMDSLHEAEKALKEYYQFQKFIDAVEKMA